ncbi:caspase domain-containing protein [Micromonospora sp. NPDC048898]|uniref:caspase family protein n=1 Tax=Micromonospora sp. NPDC048898 TaxID=3364260 RepID=UPI0037203E97
MRLPDPRRSRAVLIGTGTYRSAELADLPAVRNNVADLAVTLTDPARGAISPDRCTVVTDPADPRGVYRLLRDAAQSAEDTLLVYFAGHGRTGTRNELYLGLADTDPDELRVSALPYDLIRDILVESPAANRIVILDCCFSGRAVQDMAGSDETILGQVGIEGTYVLTATSANAVALAPLGARHTAFTGALLDLLREGVPGGPPLLTFGAVYRQLLHAAASRGIPAPRQRGTGTVDQLALARNPANDGDPVAPVAPVAPPPPAGGSLHRTRAPSPAALRGLLAWLCLAATLLYGLAPAVIRLIALLLGAQDLPNLFAVDSTADVAMRAVSLFDQPIITAAAGLVAFRALRETEGRALAGAGLLLGFGAYVAVRMPVRLHGSWTSLEAYLTLAGDHSSWWSPWMGVVGPREQPHYTIFSILRPLDSWASVFGMLLFAVAAVVAVAVCVRDPAQVSLARPSRLGRAAVVVAAGLVGAVAYLWPFNALPGDDASLLTGQLGTSMLILLLPFLRVTLQPGTLAGGLVAGWVAVLLTVVVARVSWAPPSRWTYTSAATWTCTAIIVAVGVLVTVLASRDRPAADQR